MQRVERLILVVVFLLGAPGVGANAQFVLQLSDESNTGFRDNRPANPAAGGNVGTTLGQQRLSVIERAAQIWGAQLNSSVPIRVEIRMPEQDCGSDRTILASAGPTRLIADFANAPRANTSYHVALANALAGQDHHPGGAHISANFNVRLDQGCLTSTAGWWYGLDPDEPVPLDRIAMLPVALHELAHGLGFSAQVNLQTGDYFGTPGAAPPTAWSNFLYDLEQGRHWRAMTSAQRVASARNDPHLVWSGIHSNRNLRLFLRGEPILLGENARGEPEPIDELGQAEFGPGWPQQPLQASVALVNDGVAADDDPPGTIHDGCEAPFVNGARLAGRIALIDRGLCPFTTKVQNAQAHGAIAVVIVNNQDGPPPTMGGTAVDINIPVVAVRREVGESMKRRLLRPHLRLALTVGEQPAGTAQGCVRMFAPSDLVAGSSVSHFHRDAFPNLLMEPSITRSLFDEVDLTLDLFRDLGWSSPIAEPTPPLTNECALSPL